MAGRSRNLREYRSWSFWDRTFFVGLAFSLLWHFFWFFSIKIVVSPPKKAEKPRPYLVSLGPVMDDAIFKTLVESRPELSQSFYRRPSDFLAAAELPIETIPRQMKGDVVSVPFGKKFIASLREVVGGVKAAPDFEWAEDAALSLPGETEEEKEKRLRLAREQGL